MPVAISAAVAAVRGSSFSISRLSPVPRVTRKRSPATAAMAVFGPNGERVIYLAPCAASLERRDRQLGQLRRARLDRGGDPVGGLGGLDRLHRAEPPRLDRRADVAKL